MPRFIVHTDRRELEMFRTFFPDEYLDSHILLLDFGKIILHRDTGDPDL